MTVTIQITETSGPCDGRSLSAEEFHMSLAALHAHFDNRFDQLANQLNERLDQIATQINERLDQMSAESDAAIAKIQADVTALTTVDQSAITLLQGLKTALDAAIANSVSTGNLTALTDLSTSLESQTTAMAAAVTANTPAGPTPGP